MQKKVKEREKHAEKFEDKAKEERKRKYMIAERRRPEKRPKVIPRSAEYYFHHHIHIQCRGLELYGKQLSIQLYTINFVSLFRQTGL